MAQGFFGARRPVRATAGRNVLGRALATTTAVCAAASLAPAAASAEPLAKRLGDGVTIARHQETGKVRFVGTAPGAPIARPAGVAASAAPRSVASVFLDRHSRAFGLRDGSRELRISDSSPVGHGNSAVRFQQLYHGIPVIGGELVVNLDARERVLSVGGETVPHPALGERPRVTATDARRTALEVIAKSYELDEADLDATRPRLSIFDSRVLGGPGLDRPVLVWRMDVTAGAMKPVRELVLVDAQRGTVALHFNQIAEAKDRRVCDAVSTAGQVPCSAPVRTEGGAATAVQDVNDAYDFSGDTYDFFFDRFGRDSLDGAGLTLNSTVRYCPSPSDCPYQNAFWNGQQMVYGEGFAAADDVVGHELTHGVTDFSSHLFYYYQSGAINESMSDVFGELIDQTNGAGNDAANVKWLMGEDIPGIGAIRDMEDPTTFGDPDRMNSFNYTADDGENDAGGVHTNSGVNNKAAFLITDGGTFNGRTVTGLGIDKAARIYYQVDSSMLTSASDYADLGLALNQACNNLVGTGGITAANCVEVSDATGATEMASEPANAPAPEAPVCDSGGMPANEFADDLENPASGNWTQMTNAAVSPVNHWYYPPNSNPYGVDTTYATSGDMNLWGDDVDTTSDSSIALANGVTIPSGGAFLRFRHAFGFEDAGFGTNYDGGVVEYSTDGGANWSDVGALPVVNGYNGTLESSNPLGARQAFVAESNGYISTRYDVSSLAGQSVRFRFRLGTDPSVGDYGWFIDDVSVYACAFPPNTTISSGPAAGSRTNDPTPTFAFSSNKASSTFECSVNGGAYGGCASPFTTGTLANGLHRFRVRAIDASNNTDPTPATRSFAVDTRSPNTQIRSGPANGSITRDRTPSFGFRSTEIGSTFRCKVDRGWFVRCRSPYTTRRLADGWHTLRVRATDRAANRDLIPARRSFRVDTKPPQTTIAGGPSGRSRDLTPTFALRSNEPGSTFRCKLDATRFRPCATRYTRRVAPGRHVLRVQAIDRAGNRDRTLAARGWIVRR